MSRVSMYFQTKRDVSEDDAAPFHLDQMPHAEKATEGWLQAIRVCIRLFYKVYRPLGAKVSSTACKYDRIFSPSE